jgi:ABC-2 type transport system permease protein
LNVASSRLVAQREIRERGRSTALRVGTVISVLLVAAAVAVPALRKGHRPTYRVGVVGRVSAPLEDSIVRTGAAVGATVHLRAEPSEAASAADLRANRIDVAVIGRQRLLVKKGVSRASTSTRAIFVASVAQAVSLQLGLEQSGIPPDRAASLAHAPPLPVDSLQPAPHNDTQRLTAFYGVLLLFFLVQQYGYWLLIGVVEEKSTRVVEVLLATIRPAELLIGKAVGIGILALTQATLLVVTALGMGAAVGSDLLKGSAPEAVLMALLWFLLGYTFYCSLYAAAGSLASRVEDAQNIGFPLQIPLLIGYIATIPVLTTGNASTLVTVMAYLPPTAPLAMPTLVAVGKAGPLQVVVSVVITLAGSAVLIRAASAVYTRAILRTGRRLKLREVLRAPAPAA